MRCRGNKKVFGISSAKKDLHSGWRSCLPEAIKDMPQGNMRQQHVILQADAAPVEVACGNGSYPCILCCAPDLNPDACRSAQQKINANIHRHPSTQHPAGTLFDSRPLRHSHLTCSCRMQCLKARLEPPLPRQSSRIRPANHCDVAQGLWQYPPAMRTFRQSTAMASSPPTWLQEASLAPASLGICPIHIADLHQAPRRMALTSIPRNHCWTSWTRQ